MDSTNLRFNDYRNDESKENSDTHQKLLLKDILHTIYSTSSHLKNILHPPIKEGTLPSRREEHNHSKNTNTLDILAKECNGTKGDIKDNEKIRKL